MFFKRNGKTKTPAEAAGSNGNAKADGQSDRAQQNTSLSADAIRTSHMPAKPTPPLPADQLRRRIDPKTLGVTSTADVAPCRGPIGQERALSAIAFGADMDANDFNIFVLGPPATGKSTAVKSYLEHRTTTGGPIRDWVYVNNFEDPNRPRALALPCGEAHAFAKALIRSVDELRQTVPAVIESDEYRARRREIDDGFRAGQEEAFEALNAKAAAQNIAIMRTQMGLVMAPMHDGKVVKPEVFNTLPQEMRKAIEGKIETLQAELARILETVPKSDKERRARIAELNREIGTEAVTAALEDVRATFGSDKNVAGYLDAVATDMVANIAIFLPDSEEAEQPVKQSIDTVRHPRFRRYLANVMVSHTAIDGAATCRPPLVEELNPSYGNLVGRIEHIAQMGTLLTDFLLLKPGALHAANGGYLLIDARKVLLSPFAWEALKRAIKSREIRVESPVEALTYMSTQTLDPEPIPLDVKVVLFGERELYYLLAAGDPDFNRLFQVQADFEDTIIRSGENDQRFISLISAIVANHGLRHVSATGLARLIEEGARLAGDQTKLSVQIGRLADIVREADYWARRAGRDLIDGESVERAITEAIERVDRVRDRSHETIRRDIVMIDTTSEKVGQINGLAVLQIGAFAFGRPNRITARVRLGSGRLTDIEREAELGGALHTKGVMILWGYLSGKFAEDMPLALAATLGFEQSYGGVEGDSASSAELYALLSALSRVPIRQGLAVTGSVNQYGEVQAIGGVNEKIEGFFDICSAKGLTGEQGVLIPKANVQHLMLRSDVVEAVETGKFNVYAVATIDEGIELLTGIEAGKPDSAGRFPPGTLNARVREKLEMFAEAARAYAARREADGQARDDGAAVARPPE